MVNLSKFDGVTDCKQILFAVTVAGKWLLNTRTRRACRQRLKQRYQRMRAQQLSQHDQQLVRKLLQLSPINNDSDVKQIYTAAVIAVMWVSNTRLRWMRRELRVLNRSEGGRDILKERTILDAYIGTDRNFADLAALLDEEFSRTVREAAAQKIVKLARQNPLQDKFMGRMPSFHDFRHMYVTAAEQVLQPDLQAVA